MKAYIATKKHFIGHRGMIVEQAQRFMLSDEDYKKAYGDGKEAPCILANAPEANNVMSEAQANDLQMKQMLKEVLPSTIDPAAAYGSVGLQGYGLDAGVEQPALEQEKTNDGETSANTDVLGA